MQELKKNWAPLRAFASLFIVMTMVACGGEDDGGGGSPPPPPPPPPGNSAPTSNAGTDQSVSEGQVVALSGSGSDVDNDPLTFAWTQTGGSINVTIVNASSQSATFTAPDVAAGSPQMLTFQLSVSDGTLTTNDTIDVTVSEPQSAVVIAGTVSYEFVNPANVCRGLDFSNITARPIRGVPVQLIDDSDGTTVIASGTTGDDGSYSFGNIPADTMVRLRLRAELQRPDLGAQEPSWNVELKDNFIPGASDDDSPGNPPFLQGTLYAVEFAGFDTGSVDQPALDFVALTGWDNNSSSYTGDRSAGLFAILDAVYSAMQFVLTADPAADFDALDIYWSIQNTWMQDGTSDISAGELNSAFYSTGIDSLFLFGDAIGRLPNSVAETDEFDDHLIVHEWGHYFEDTFSRSDSIGGSHTVGDQLDPRVAFGEGWATALSGMALNNQLYCDTGTPGTAEGFGIGTEDGSYDPQGWFDELGVMRFIYDLWDDSPGEPGDAGSIGWTPIFNTMVGPQRNSPAFTSVFTFAAELRTMLNPTDAAFLDSQLVREDMTPGFDIWGAGETSIVGSGRDVFPIYVDIPTNGTTVPACVNTDYDPSLLGNKLAEYLYFQMDVQQQARYDIEIITTTVLPGPDTSDPDMFVIRDGQIVAVGGSGDANQEIFRTPILSVGMHIADLNEFRFSQSDTDANYPDRICFDITMTPVP